MFLQLPNRTEKPRHKGLSILIDNGHSTQSFCDIIESHAQYIDFVKFGWCTALLTKDLGVKIDCLQRNNVKYYLGGTFFEKSLMQNKLHEYIDYNKRLGCNYLELSNGTIPLSNSEKAKYIAKLSVDFMIFSEVGYKDNDRSEELFPRLWVQYIQQDLEAGAMKVILEARESGTSGMCLKTGQIRYGLLNEILSADIDAESLIFETPNKSLQTYFINKLGSNVNLANIPLDDVIGLETLRLGLRSDTLMKFEQVTDWCI